MEVARIIEWRDLGIVSYREASEIQARLRGERIVDKIGDRLLLLEHPPVFTMGLKDCEGDFLSPAEEIAAEGIEVVKTNRGGRVTYHGPGQLVAYFICKLDSFGIGIKDFVRSIEEVCLRLLAGFGIEAVQDSNNPGLWVGIEKIVAIGLNVSRGVTQHGLALNVDPDLTAYRHIVACGLRDRGVTSMARILGSAPPMDEVKKCLVARVGGVLVRKMQHSTPEVEWGGGLCKG